jgi:hypothetical protein
LAVLRALVVAIAQRQRIARSEQKVGAIEVVVDVAVLAAAVDALHEAIGIHVRHRELREHVITERDVDRGLQIAAVERTGANAYAAAEFIRGPPRHVLDRAAERRVAEQSALRAAQDFDAVDLYHPHREQADGIGLIDAVDVHGNTWHATHAEYRRRFDLAACAALYRQIGRHGVHAADHVDSSSFKRLAGEGGNGERHLLQAFLTPARTDDDLV